MANADLTKALTAATRFGDGPRPGELRIIAGDPRGWAMQQLDAAPAPLRADGLSDSATLTAAFLTARRERRDTTDEGRKAENERIRAVYFAESGARLGAAVASDKPLLERLTRFWSNHFTVSCVRPPIHSLAGAFEREAIRPHVTGRFADMLLAVAHHPAMLLYLDQAQSFGPDSPAGQRLKRGLNENLAREMLELHTLGVDGGYTQDDVQALARILTGWSIAGPKQPDPGQFRFYPQLHEPGAQRLLGKTYPEGGEEQGTAALQILAAHPATAKHIATKLARHFISDDPPPDAVARIARVFRDTGGDLKRVTAAVVAEATAWTPFAKLRTPEELFIASCRATGFVPPTPFIVQSLHLLDQQPFFAPQPTGWPDRASDWIGPESVLHRIECGQRFAQRLPDPPEPATLVEAVFADALPDDTAHLLRAAPTRRHALALLIASPEFQRR
jgi:uncharacterized protein (DUF1800 family)